MSRIILHSLARREFLDAARYYERESLVAKTGFIHGYEHCRQQIIQNPQAGERVYKDFRRRLFQRFPYALIYRIRPGGIFIISVMHTSRDQFYWLGRD